MNEGTEIFIQQWLRKEISFEELEAKIGEVEAQKYRKILDEVDQYSVTPQDKKRSYQSLLQKRTAPKAKQVFFRTKAFQLMAASFAIVISLFFLTYDNSELVTISTKEGQDSLIVLPCGSKVTLSASSLISYDENLWSTQRTVNLQGRAFFDVVKGKSFVVAGKNEKVEVMGTSFEVADVLSTAKVICYTGKVLVSFPSKNYSKVLSPLQGVLLDKDVQEFEIESKQPEWLTGNNRYKSESLAVVLADLEADYGIKVECDQPYVFTGVVPRYNQVLALNIICKALDLTVVEDNGIYRLQKND